MSDIVKIDGSNIVQILHEGGLTGFLKPFHQHIYLVDAHIAGTTHVRGIKEIEPRLAVGMRLNFFREADNPYDPLAILIKNADGNKLGYVPRDKNEILSRLMDAGKLLYGTIFAKEFIGDWLKITIQIYLDE
jgi:hypothetical protein